MRVFSFIILFFFCLNPLHAEEAENFILRKKIQEAKKKIEEYSAKAKDNEKRAGEFLTAHAKRLMRRKNDISRLRGDASSLEKELSNKKLEKKTLERRIKNYEIQFAVFREKLKKNMGAYSISIKNGIPYNIEGRSLHVKRLIADTEFENITPEEIFNRFYNFLNKELLLAMDSEVYVKDNIKYLRIGWILMSYSDEEGKDVGILTRNKDKWIWENNLSFTMRNAVRDSMKMVEGKKAPELINFPIPMPLVRENLKGAVK